MGLFQRLFLGVDLDEEQRRANDLDRQLEELNREDLERGFYDDETFAAAEANRIQSQTPDIEGDVSEAFEEGLASGYDSITAGVNTALDAPRRFLFAAVPWYFWVLGILGLVLWINPRLLSQLLRFRR